MSDYFLFFYPDPEAVPSFEVIYCASDEEALHRAPQLAAQRTRCTQIEVWRASTLVGRRSHGPEALAM